MIEKFRDVTLMKIIPEHTLTVVCDSCGGIGNKEHDKIKVDPYLTGYYTACVALSETMAIGATPMTVVNTLSVEMEGTGRRIMDGIGAALDEIGLDQSTCLTGSTEENIPVTVTGLGITVIGSLPKGWSPPKATKEDVVMVIGRPKVGQEVIHDQGEIMTLNKLTKLQQEPSIHDILPVGSKGIAYELGEMARTANLSYQRHTNHAIDFNKSAGPATCILVATRPENQAYIEKLTGLPVSIIATFI